MKKYLPAVVAFCCLIVVTLVVFIFAVELVKSRSQQEFDHLAAAKVSIIQRSLRDKYLILESIHSAYTALGSVPTPEFSLMSRPFESETSGILGYRWIALIKETDREEFERLIALRFTDFQVIERNKFRNLVRAQSRPIHYILMPTPGEDPDFFSGLDLASNPDTLSAIEHSIRIKGIASTASLEIESGVEGSDNDYLFQAYAPVFAESSSEPFGLIAGLFNLADIVDSSIMDHGINLTLVNEEVAGDVGKSFHYEEESDLRKQSLLPSSLFMPDQFNSSFQLGGRNWSFVAEPASSYVIDSGFALPWIALIAGIVLSLMLSLYFAVFIRQKNRVILAQQAVKDIEVQLYRTQKMEAVGQLASGIAHDFNNILTGVLGYSSLAQERIVDSDDEELKKYVHEVVKAGARGQDLVAKLSAFNRNKPSTSTLHEINPLVKNALDLLRPTISSGILINYSAEENLPKAVVDPTNFEQIVINLCINARDSIQDGELNPDSRIDITLKKAFIKSVECSSCNKIAEGEYLMLSVKDSGKGISEENIGMIFTPFFTSKEAGKGSGMGLSIIHGIVHSYEGHIILISEQGHGTEFRVIFPIGNEQLSLIKEKI